MKKYSKLIIAAIIALIFAEEPTQGDCVLRVYT